MKSRKRITSLRISALLASLDGKSRSRLQSFLVSTDIVHLSEGRNQDVTRMNNDLKKLGMEGIIALECSNESDVGATEPILSSLRLR